MPRHLQLYTARFLSLGTVVLHGVFLVKAVQVAGALPKKSGSVFEAVLYRGELSRGNVAQITGASERQARRVTSALIECGALASESSRAPLRLAFPARLAWRWMPRLFPERVG